MTGVVQAIGYLPEHAAIRRERTTPRPGAAVKPPYSVTLGVRAGFRRHHPFGPGASLLDRDELIPPPIHGQRAHGVQLGLLNLGFQLQRLQVHDEGPRSG